MKALYQRDSLLYVFAVSASLLLSFWIACRETVINPDAVCYLGSAASMGRLGLSGAMHLCGQAGWPLYPGLIYLFSQLTHFSYPATAHLLNGFFSALSITFFILIVKELGGSRLTLWLAAFVILLAHDFNGVREYIVRDHGFWAFYLISIWLLLRYFRQPRLIKAVTWSMVIGIAALFRIEGAIFLLALPFSAWFCFHYSLAKRIQCFFSLHLFTLLIVLALGMWSFLHPQQTLHQWGRLPEVIQQFQYGLMGIVKRYQITQDALAHHVLTFDSVHEAGLVWGLVLIIWYFINVIGNLAWVYALLVLYAWGRKVPVLTSPGKLVIFGYLIVNVMVTLGFFLENLFLSKRYLIALSLILMLWVPFALQELSADRAVFKKRLLLILATFFIVLSSLGGIFDFGYSKSYIAEAGNWLAKHVPANAALYTNDYQLMYYSQHYGDSLFEKAKIYLNINTIAHAQWKKYDYLALRVDKKEEGETALILHEISLSPIHVFSNKRGDRVVIYRVHS